jgi:hypothetical protein
MPQRKFTTQEIAIARLLAGDPMVSRGRLIEILHKQTGAPKKMGYRTILRLIEECGAQWVEGDRSRIARQVPRRSIPLDDAQAKRLRAMAADPAVSMKQAGRLLGVCAATILRMARDQDIEWIRGNAAKDPEREPTRPVARPNEHKWAQFQISPPETTLRRKTPKVPVPEYRLTPEVRMGVPGFAWECEALQVEGWKAGRDPDVVRAEVHRDLALVAARHSMNAGKSAGQAIMRRGGL